MREIKFRAWCEGKHGSMTFKKTEMEYDVTVYKGAYAAMWSGWEIYGSYPTVPLMQYTGLKDKNGKEIYEGDIVKWDTGVLFTIVWNQEWCSFELMSKDFTSSTLDGVEKYGEIIGNIYENPELLSK